MLFAAGKDKVYIGQELDIGAQQCFNTLKEIFEYLGSSEKRCYVAIDEFQQIVEYPEKGVEALLRSYIHIPIEPVQAVKETLYIPGMTLVLFIY